MPNTFNFPVTSAGPTSPLSVSSGSFPAPSCSCSATNSIGSPELEYKGVTVLSLVRVPRNPCDLNKVFASS